MRDLVVLRHAQACLDVAGHACGAGAEPREAQDGAASAGRRPGRERLLLCARGFTMYRKIGWIDGYSTREKKRADDDILFYHLKDAKERS